MENNQAQIENTPVVIPSMEDKPGPTGVWLKTWIAFAGLLVILFGYAYVFNQFEGGDSFGVGKVGIFFNNLAYQIPALITSLFVLYQFVASWPVLRRKSRIVFFVWTAVVSVALMLGVGPILGLAYLFLIAPVLSWPHPLPQQLYFLSMYSPLYVIGIWGAIYSSPRRIIWNKRILLLLVLSLIILFTATGCGIVALETGRSIT